MQIAAFRNAKWRWRTLIQIRDFGQSNRIFISVKSNVSAPRVILCSNEERRATLVVNSEHLPHKRQKDT